MSIENLGVKLNTPESQTEPVESGNVESHQIEENLNGDVFVGSKSTNQSQPIINTTLPTSPSESFVPDTSVRPSGEISTLDFDGIDGLKLNGINPSKADSFRDVQKASTQG